MILAKKDNIKSTIDIYKQSRIIVVISLPNKKH